MSKKQLAKVLALVIAITMLGSLFAACGQKAADQAATTEKAAESTSEAATTAEPEQKELEPYEFTMYYNYDWYDASAIWGEDKVSAELKKKFNITLKQAKPEGDPVQKLNVMIASDDLPDAMMMDRDSNYLKMINLGKIVELDSFIEKYPGYKQAIMPTTMNLSKVNGKVYGMLNWANTDNLKAMAGNSGWAVNKKLYEAVGSPTLETTDDLYNFLKAVKEKGLKVDGKEVLPIQVQNSGMTYEMLFMTFFGRGMTNYVIPMNNELKLYMTHPKFEEAMLFANKLWRENLINKDAFVEKPEQIGEKLSTGRVASFLGYDIPTAIGNEARKRLREKDPENDYVVIKPIAGPGLTPADIKMNSYTTLGWNVLVVTNKAQQPERIFQLFDYMISNEGQTLLTYGPKGEMYDEVDAEGIPILKKTDSELKEEERKALGVWRWVMPGNSTFVNLTKYAANDRQPADKKDWVIEMQSKIMAPSNINKDEFMNMYTDPKTEEGIAYTAFEDLYKKSLPKIVMAKSEEQCKTAIKEAIDNAYKLGFDKAEKFMTTKWQENLKNMGK